MDRLARNVKDLLSIIETIVSKGATIKFMKENLTFSNNEKADPFQKLMLTMLGAISEFERNLILERQREGIAIAKQKGKYKGTTKKLSDEDIANIKELAANNKMTMVDIAKKYNITRQSVYNYIKG